MSVGALVVAGGFAAQNAPPLGFTSDSGRAVRELERRFADGISTDRLSETHRAMTRRPHAAGTSGGAEVAGWLARTLAAAGLTVETAEYSAYLSRPRRVQASLRLDGHLSIPLETTEPPSSFDPDTANPDLDPGHVAYSASGRVTGPVVYVNYGLPADYAALRTDGVDVSGAVVLVRYGRSHRAVKVHTAEVSGARGIILYSDPADDGAERGPVWPDGPWRSPQLLQRGNAKYSWFWHGDPLTPGIAAIAGSRALDPRGAPTLPKIPAVVVGAAEARKIFDALGRGRVEAALDVEMTAGRLPIRNVLATLRGSTDPDRIVMLGGHHDAWTFGGVDPGTSASVLVEVASGLSALARTGWRPSRTITFAFWDAEEYGLIGSTEFAEDRAALLRERVVCYVNSDYYMGDRFDAGGVPSLRDFVADVAHDLGLTAPDELAALGSGADFVAFQDFLGLPTLSFELDFDGSYGTYHSSHDTRLYFDRMGDPDRTRGPRLARILGSVALRLASADVLPFRYSQYARRIAAFIDEAASQAGIGGDALPRLAAAARRAASRADELEQAIDRHLAQGRLTPAVRRALNDALARLEQTLVDDSEPPDRRWYRHVIYGWNIHSLYDGQPLPGVTEAIRLKDAGMLTRERARLAAALARFEAGLGGAERIVQTAE
ncbi:MAG TPA: M28 family peptidase [Vicinamibacterales bacterium]|jgi:N-acetylated-alpha-linked acidic dipeptidase|nr:M28 family peptidase [Vicinamibacterales bacterium]